MSTEAYQGHHERPSTMRSAQKLGTLALRVMLAASAFGSLAPTPGNAYDTARADRPAAVAIANSASHHSTESIAVFNVQNMPERNESEHHEAAEHQPDLPEQEYDADAARTSAHEDYSAYPPVTPAVDGSRPL